MEKTSNITICDALIGVLCPPLLMFLKSGCSSGFVISLLLYVFLVSWPVSVVFTFFQLGYTDIIGNILCFLCPPIVVFCKRGCGAEFLICLLLWLLALIPGMVYGYATTWSEGSI